MEEIRVFIINQEEKENIQLTGKFILRKLWASVKRENGNKKQIGDNLLKQISKLITIILSN